MYEDYKHKVYGEPEKAEVDLRTVATSVVAEAEDLNVSIYEKEKIIANKLKELTGKEFNVSYLPKIKSYIIVLSNNKEVKFIIEI